MKKFSLPKLQLSLKKKNTEGPLWKISTKIVGKHEDTLVKIRTNKKPWTFYVATTFIWFKNYLRTVGWVFLGGIVCVGLFVLFATPIFFLKPDKIEVILVPEPVFDMGAITSILGDFSGKNIFSISTKEIFIALSENIRHIASVEKTLLFPDGVRVRVTSFPASYRAFIGEDRFLLTENGQLIPDIPEVEVPALQIYHLVQDPNVGKKTPISDVDMYGIRTILNAWQSTLALPISELKFYEQEKELHIITDKTRSIFLLENGGNQVKVLQKLIEQGHVVLSRLVYTDLRIQNKVYTCAQSEGACANNIRTIYGS